MTESSQAASQAGEILLQKTARHLDDKSIVDFERQLVDYMKGTFAYVSVDKRLSEASSYLLFHILSAS